MVWVCPALQNLDFTWTLPSAVGKKTFANITNLVKGDTITFKWKEAKASLAHDVWSFDPTKPNLYKTCKFSSPAKQLYPTSGKKQEGTYKFTIKSTGTYLFSCSTPGHCTGAQKLAVIVKK